MPPLPGTLNALNAPPQPPPEHGGLVIPNNPGGPYVPRPPQREMGIGEMLGKLGGMAVQLTDIPRMTAWNLGPSIVGRSGQGPQTGADALEGLGLDYNQPWQRALGHGAGKALDLVANPLNLIGAGAVRPGAARAIAPAAETIGPLTRRLPQYAGPGLQDATRAAADRLGATAIENISRPPYTMSPWGADVLSQARIADPSRVPVAIARPRAVASLPETVPGGGPTAAASGIPAPATVQRPGQLPFTPERDVIAELPEHIRNRIVRDPTPPGAPGSVQGGYRYDADALRRIQLNSPQFNPAEPAFGLGTGQFGQDAGQAARYGLGEYNPLTTAQFMPGAAAVPSMMDRLRRVIPPGPVDY